MVLADGGSGPHIPGPDGFGVFTSIVYYHLPAWRRFVQIAGTTHGSFTDDEWLISQLAAGGIVPRTGPLSAVSWIGTLPADRAIAIERTYITAFFDLWLKDTDNHLLDGLAAEYPEVTLYR
jgi:hypothetical protein